MALRAAVTSVSLATLVTVTLTAATPASAAGPSATCPLPRFGPGATYQPTFGGLGLRPHVTNPLFPLPPGRVLVYAGVKDGRPALDVVVATAGTRTVAGVTTRIVEDRLYLSGVLAERTSDYYAQDRCGNVWYLGEDTAELDRSGRVVSTEGTWHAGVRGAQPGVFMQARPQLGRRFRQEWLAGEAEDVFRAVDRSAPVRVPYGRFDHALRTSEWTALEPGVRDAKVYVRGLGEVREASQSGPREVLELVDVIP